MSDSGFRRFDAWWKSMGPAQGLVMLGSLCGAIALVWVAYLAGAYHGRAESPPAPCAVAPVAPVPKPPGPTVEGAIPMPSGTHPPEKPPETWTRMAGLNVWTAGQRVPEGDETPRIVIMLHGFARPRGTLLAMAEREAARFGTIFVFPEAPVALDWFRRAWWRPRKANGTPAYGVETLSPDAKKLIASRTVIKMNGDVEHAREIISGLIREVRKRFNVQNDELVLAGFSQGATLALAVALEIEEPIGGLAFLSGKPLTADYTADRWDHLEGVPVLIAHGRYDPIASFPAVDKMRRTMKAAGVDLVWVPFDGGHAFSPAAQSQLSKFIRRTQGAPPPATPPPIGFGSGPVESARPRPARGGERR